MKYIYLTSALLLLLTVTVLAQAPLQVGQMAFQGELRDAESQPVEDGSYSMVFAIYDDPTAGAVLWTEAQSVTVTSGLFTVNLGSVTPIPSDVFTPDTEVECYLEMSVEGEVLLPRSGFSGVPYSLVSARMRGDIITDENYLQVGSTNSVGANLRQHPQTTLSRLIVNPEIGNLSFGNGDADRQGLFVSPDEMSFGNGDADWQGLQVTNTELFFGNGDADRFGLSVTADQLMFGNGDADRVTLSDQGLFIINNGGTPMREVLDADAEDTVVKFTADGIYYSPGAFDGYVLTTDVFGNGTWQAPSGGVGAGCWLCPGNYTYLADIDDSVGIGTETPTEKLDVVGNIQVSSSLIAGASPMYLKGAPVRVGRSYSSSESQGGVVVAVDNFGTGWLTGVHVNSINLSGGGASGVSASASSDAMERIGVAGLAYPRNQALEGSSFGVSGRAQGGLEGYGCKGVAFEADSFNVGLYGEAYDANGYGIGVFGTSHDNAVNYAAWFEGDTYISDNLGVGIASPITKLHLNFNSGAGEGWPSLDEGFTISNNTVATGHSANINLVSGSASDGSINFGDFSFADKGQITYSNNTDNMRFLTGMAERMLISGSGDVGIGTTTPATELHLNLSGTPSLPSLNEGFTISSTGATSINMISGSSTDGAIRFGDNSLAHWGAIHYYNSTNTMVFNTFSTNRMAINQSGYVGIATTSPTNILTIAQGFGSAIADGWAQYSSLRWKENITTISNPIAKVMKLRGVEFDWRKSGKHDIGLIAEDVGKVIPEIVSYEENGVDAKSVDYARLVAVLIEATKEHQKEIGDLKAEILSLKMLLKELARSPNVTSDAKFGMK